MTASPDLNKKINIVIEIKGGFGNQIFQFTFANYLRNKGFKVKVNTRFYNQFRKNDIDNGGEGAPLTPVYHHLLHPQHQKQYPRRHFR